MVGLSERVRGILVPLLAATAAIAAIAWSVASSPPPIEVTGRPIEVAEDEYVSSRTCRSCHPSHYATWQASYHRTMTQLASPESVLGDFDAVDAEFQGARFDFERRGDEFWVEMNDPLWKESGEAPRVWRRVVMTTGSHHLQLYWYATGRSRALGLLPLAHFIADNRWFPTQSNFLRPPGDELDIRTGDWNHSCIQCHSVAGRPRLKGRLEMDTRVAELGIACEACHGPGQEHVRVNRLPWRRYLLHHNTDGDSTIVNPARLPADRASEVCGRCHSVIEIPRDKYADFAEFGHDFRPGEKLRGSSVRVVRGRARMEQNFWPDAMVRVPGREYVGLLDSPCYQGGEFTCLSCHQMHRPDDDPRPLEAWRDDQLAAGMRSNEACLQCHEGFRESAEDHTHHIPGSSGSLCYNCHMPHTSQGLRKAVRSHQISSPSVATDLATGRPNACNNCHLDKTLAWTAQHLDGWFEQPPPALSAFDRSVPASLVDLLKGDASQRGLAAWHMGWAPAREISDVGAWGAPFLAHLMDDPYDAVRYVAHRSLGRLPGFESFEYNFVAPRPQRRSQAEAAGARWADARRAAGESADLSYLLSDPAAVGGSEVFETLASERDDRPVWIRE